MGQLIQNINFSPPNKKKKKEKKKKKIEKKGTKKHDHYFSALVRFFLSPFGCARL